jgi:flagellin
MPMNVSSNLSAMQALHDLSSVAGSSASAAMATARSRLQTTQDRVSKYSSSVSVDISADARAQFAGLAAASGSSARASGALMDADLAIESTRLASLQTQQQLGVQSLSMANQSSQALFALFRG